MKTRILTMATGLCVLLLAITLCIGVPSSKATAEDEIKAAIEKELAWLAQRQNDGAGNLGDVARTGLAVLEFADHARELEPPTDPFDPGYMYSGNVINGLNYILSRASIVDISVQPAGDPDTRDNAIGVYWHGPEGIWDHPAYHTSIAMMAIAASEAPNRVVSGGICNGWTYQQVLQYAVDYLAFCQSDIHD
jgi:hypothetical protein